MTNSNRAAARRTGRAAVSGAARGSRAGDEPAWSPGPLPTSETRFERPAQRLARRARRRTGALGTAPLSLYKREDFSAIAACSSRGRNGRKPPARNAENRYEVPNVVRSGLMVLGSPLFAASQPTTAPETFAPSAASHDCPRLPTETIGTKAKTCSSTPPYPDTGVIAGGPRRGDNRVGVLSFVSSPSAVVDKNAVHRTKNSFHRTKKPPSYHTK
ncbi:hypothetical protein Purlil1_11548 [Purpureocillium lilacinum]|uniref:Uncharacterized protein n=1 Tax=Purpureocillium lilacinum TaxID=33203 RepID=A0ABR0BJD8_PURLI|nr:hypothetical protein Purlil1_11548 [Purpureocillium lilacinum]